MEFVLTTPIGHRLQMISSIDAYAKAPGFQDIIVRKTLPLLQRGKTAAQLKVSGYRVHTGFWFSVTNGKQDRSGSDVSLMRNDKYAD